MGDSQDTTYMGMALVGGNAGQVKIGDDGCIRQAVTDLGAVNAYHMTIADGATVTSGYIQGYYASLTTSSDTAWSTANTQGNVFATDISLAAGTVACEVEGSYVYISGSSNCTKSSANISGQVVYIDDLGGSPSSRSGIQLHFADGNVGSTQDAAILIRLEGSSCALTNVIQFAGTANKKPAYFFATNAAGQASTFLQAITISSGGTQNLALVCNINGSQYNIPLWAAT